MTSVDTSVTTLTSVPTSQYTMQELVDIYNQTRVDYIIPMPMNVKRLADYVHDYDIDLDASVVTMNGDAGITGISMLGIRDNRSWITRLGVLPVKRRNGTGQFIMDNHISAARARKLDCIQLEVIKHNVPAHQLFLKNGFRETRELLVIRRPPIDVLPFKVAYKQVSTISLETDEIRQVLRKETDTKAAWTEENCSLLNAGSLRGLKIETGNGQYGYAIYQFTPFQLTHFWFSPSLKGNSTLTSTLLHHIHTLHPKQDAKIENVPLDDPLWAVYQSMGYVEAFRRIEMVLDLRDYEVHE